jgi:hypothetical protein
MNLHVRTSTCSIVPDLHYATVMGVGSFCHKGGTATVARPRPYQESIFAKHPDQIERLCSQTRLPGAVDTAFLIRRLHVGAYRPREARDHFP